MPFGCQRRTAIRTTSRTTSRCIREIETPPFAMRESAGGHVCLAPVSRKYTPHNRGLGFDILDSESKACFVPDQELPLPDALIDEIESTTHYEPHLDDPTSRVTGGSASQGGVKVCATEAGAANAVHVGRQIRRSTPRGRSKCVQSSGCNACETQSAN